MNTSKLTAFCVILFIGIGGGCQTDGDPETAAGRQPLPQPATWASDRSELPDPLPPQLRETHRVAADYLGLPLNEVFFVDVDHRRWGDAYSFARRGEYDSCSVQVPGMRVFQERLREPWVPPNVERYTLPLSKEQALEVAKVFVTRELRIPMRQLERPSGPEGGPTERQRFWRFHWLRVRDEVFVPGHVNVQVKAATAEVTLFVNLILPLEVGVEPSVSQAKGEERARAWLRGQANSQRNKDNLEAAVVTDGYLQVEYFPLDHKRGRARGGMQRLVWVIYFQFPLPAILKQDQEDWIPTETRVFVDAHRGQVLDSQSRPAYLAPGDE